MRRCYQVVLSLIFVALSVTAYSQQTAYQQEVFTGPRAGARVHSGVSTGYHQIAWETSGGPGACLIGLDYSADGMVWYLGATIPIHDCTSSGTSIVAGPQNVNFVRMNMNALSTGSAVRATYTGFQTNPGGPTGTVTSVFGRTGQIQAQAGDYSVALITGAAPLFSPNFQGQPTAPTPSPGDSSTLVATTAFVAQAIAGCCGGGGGGGGVTTGTVNALAKYNTTTTVGPSLATDDGTTFSYTGTGGIAAPKISMTGVGPYSLTSVTGALPSPPATGNNQLVSGTDGWYVSNNGAAFVGPLGVGGGGGGTGTVGPGTVGHISKFTTTTNVSDSLLQDDGTNVTAPTPAAGDNSTKVATTAFVNAAISGGGGGGTPTPQPINHSAQLPECQVMNNSALNSTTISSLNILVNDTVVIAVWSNAGGNNATFTAVDSGNSTYTQRVRFGPNPTGAVAAILSTDAGAGHASNSVTVTNTGVNGTQIVCVATYVGVSGIGATNVRGSATAGTSTFANLPSGLQDSNGYLVAMLANHAASNPLTPVTGNIVQQAQGLNGSAGLCENTSATAGVANMPECRANFATSSGWEGTGLELRCCTMTGPPATLYPGPKVVAYQSYPITASAMASTAVCSTTNCPAGLYRASFYTVVSTACTAGDLTPHIQYTDEVGPKDVDVFRTGGTSYPMTFTAGNLGSRQQIFYSTGATAVSVSTVTTACSSGSAAGTMHVTVERLQ